MIILNLINIFQNFDYLNIFQEENYDYLFKNKNSKTISLNFNSINDFYEKDLIPNHPCISINSKDIERANLNKKIHSWGLESNKSERIFQTLTLSSSHSISTNWQTFEGSFIIDTSF